MNGLLADPETGRRMGEAGRAKALREFSLERMADRIIDIYRRG
jgi:glycosyltransferase involved in cell wall biosynthesis